VPTVPLPPAPLTSSFAFIHVLPPSEIYRPRLRGHANRQLRSAGADWIAQCGLSADYSFQRKATPEGVPTGLWTTLFPGQIPGSPIPIQAEPVPADGFTVDGHPVVAVEVGHSDRTTPRSCTLPRSPWLPRATWSTTTSTSTWPKRRRWPGGLTSRPRRRRFPAARQRVRGAQDEIRDDAPAAIGRRGGIWMTRPGCSRRDRPRRSSSTGCSACIRTGSIPTSSGCPPRDGDEEHRLAALHDHEQPARCSSLRSWRKRQSFVVQFPAFRSLHDRASSTNRSDQPSPRRTRPRIPCCPGPQRISLRVADPGDS
jgi:hypothetical protein